MKIKFKSEKPEKSNRDYSKFFSNVLMMILCPAFVREI